MASRLPSSNDAQDGATSQFPHTSPVPMETDDIELEAPTLAQQQNHPQNFMNPREATIEPIAADIYEDNDPRKLFGTSQLPLEREFEEQVSAVSAAKPVSSFISSNTPFHECETNVKQLVKRFENADESEREKGNGSVAKLKEDSPMTSIDLSLPAQRCSSVTENTSNCQKVSDRLSRTTSKKIHGDLEKEKENEDGFSSLLFPSPAIISETCSNQPGFTPPSQEISLEAVKTQVLKVKKEKIEWLQKENVKVREFGSTTKKSINILVLGQTGVGKSTWINALVNYLTYKTLDEAIAAEAPICAIPTKFTMFDDNYQRHDVHLGAHDNEVFVDNGQSATQSAKTYLCEQDEHNIYIIDTPGINDTRGHLKDEENIQNILRSIAPFKEIHAILRMDENISDSEEIGDNVDVVFEDDENGTHEEPNMDGDDGVDESEGKIIEDDSTSALYAHEKDVFCVEASGTRWIGSGGEDDMAHIWDLSASPTDPVLSIQHNDSVVSIAFNSTGTLVATGDMSGRIFITQLSDLSKRSEISDCSDIEWMFWHKSSDILFVGDSDGSAWMWLISQTGIAQQKVYSSGNATTSSGLLLPDGRRLLVGYDDGTLKLWQLQNQTNSGITCDSAVLSIAHSETQPLAAVGTANGTVYLLNSTVDANLRALKTFATSDPSQAEDMETEETERSVECLTFCKEHSWIAVGRNDGTTIVYETDTHNTRFTHTNETNQAVVKCLWIGYLLAVASVDGTIVIFDARSGNIVKELRCGGDQVLDFSLLQVQPQKLIVACSGGAIRFFDL